MENKMELNKLIKEKERLEQHLEYGKNVLVFSELNFVRKKIKEIKSRIEQLQ